MHQDVTWTNQGELQCYIVTAESEHSTGIQMEREIFKYQI